MKELFSKAAVRFKKLFSVASAKTGNSHGKADNYPDNNKKTSNSTGKIRFKRKASGSVFAKMLNWVSLTKKRVICFIRSIPSFVSKYKLVSTCAAVIAVIAITVLVGIEIGNNSNTAVNSNKEENAIIDVQVPEISAVPNDTYSPSPTLNSEPQENPSPEGGLLPPDNPVPGLHAKPTDVPIVANRGEHNEIIPSVQERLMELWYMDPDEPTDYFGSITEGALNAFQRRNELEITGLLDMVTYNTLMSESARVYMTVLGDSGSDVEYVQSRLYDLGYLENGVTGVFDELTHAAVIEFQTANNLGVDGKVGIETKEALYSPDAIGKAFMVGDRGEEVERYQVRLQVLGYLTTEPDGVYGKDTEMAVRRFQEQNSLIADGYLGPTTRELLMSDEAKGNALCYGMNGSDVLNIQRRLYELNYLKAKDINSYYTALTEKAVRLFQKNNDLLVDGKVGKNTMKILFSDDSVKAENPVTNNSGSSNSGSNNGGNSGSNNGGNNGGNSGSNNGGNSGGNSGNNDGSDVGSRIDKFLKIAKNKVGSKYVRGGKGPNVFDCSGFVYWCLNQAGVSQGYMTSRMWANTTRYQRNNNIDKIKRGDVIVYDGHVAIALGNWQMVDASQSLGKVVIRSFNSSYWRRVFICSYRIFR